MLFTSNKRTIYNISKGGLYANKAEKARLLLTYMNKEESMDDKDDKRNWMITDMDIDLKNKCVAEAKMTKKTVAELMCEILRSRYATTKFITS